VVVQAEWAVGANAFGVAVEAAFNGVFGNVVWEFATFSVAGPADGVLAPSFFQEEAVEVFFGFSKEFGCGGPLLAAGVACGKSVGVGLSMVTVVVAEE
jgi:hypothetical protein